MYRYLVVLYMMTILCRFSAFLCVVFPDIDKGLHYDIVCIIDKGIVILSLMMF